MSIIWRRKWQSNPYSCPENPMDREAWQATVHGVARVRHDLTTKHHHQQCHLCIDFFLGMFGRMLPVKLFVPGGKENLPKSLHVVEDL